VDRFGADALRYTVTAGMGLGVDIALDPDDLDKSFATGRNFVTKLWNIGRFLLTNVGAEPVRAVEALDPAALTRADHWILARLDEAVRECDAALGPARPTDGRWSEAERPRGLRLNDYAESARRFVWNELADWYLESVKGRLAEPGDDREVARAVLAHAFDRALRLLHPIIPFVTESLWQRLPGRVEGELLPVAGWPTPAGRADERRAAEFELVRQAVSALRAVRSDYAIPPSRTVEEAIVPGDAAEERAVLEAEAPLVGRLTRCTVRVADAAPAEAAAHVLLAGGATVVVPLAGLVDLEKECARLRGELADLETQLGALEQRLGNEKFTSRAPAHVVEAERQKAAEWTARRGQLRRKVESLCGR
jgi:valyl-tRNA synthetase